MSDDHHHSHDHDELQSVKLGDLTSVGIDIGSSTSHLMFSKMHVGYPSLHCRRPEVLERKVLSRSPVLLTPFSICHVDQCKTIEPLLEAKRSNHLVACHEV